MLILQNKASGLRVSILAATKGTAITLVNAKYKRRLANIEKLIERQIDRIPLPAHLGKAPTDEPSTEKRPFVKKKKFFKKKVQG